VFVITVCKKPPPSLEGALCFKELQHFYKSDL
jgi:hypothetical protein